MPLGKNFGLLFIIKVFLNYNEFYKNIINSINLKQKN